MMAVYSGLRPLLPREHGLWSWLVVPLGASVLLAPDPSTTAAAVAMILAAGASNATRRRALVPAGVSGALAVVTAGLAVFGSQRPAELATLFLAIGAAGALLTWRFHKPLPRSSTRANLEAGIILGLAAVAAAVAVIGGVDPIACIGVQLSLAAWQVTGLWWINRSFSRARNLEPWTFGPAMLATVWIAAAGFGLSVGLAAVALLPAVYWLRTWLQKPMESARDAKRIGLTELYWTLGVTAGLVALS